MSLLHVLSGLVLFLGFVQGRNDSRVAYGTGVSSTKYPSYTALFDKKRFICGGILIAPNIVLTAAHCISGGDVQPDMIAMGDIRLGGTQNRYLKSAKITASVKQRVWHQKYDQKSISNDIGILILSRPVTFPLAKLSKSSPKTGSSAAVIGLGLTHTQISPESLRETTMRVRGRTLCQSGRGTLCLQATKLNNGDYREICSGDSGGPAYYKSMVVGVTSYGPDVPCGKGDVSVYTDVGYYYDSFIQPLLDRYAVQSGNKPSYNAYIIKKGNQLLSMDVKDCSAVRVYMADARAGYKGQLWNLKGKTMYGEKVHNIYATVRGNCKMKNTLYLTVENGDPIQEICPEDDEDYSPAPSNPPPDYDEDFSPTPSNPPPDYDEDYSPAPSNPPPDYDEDYSPAPSNPPPDYDEDYSPTPSNPPPDYDEDYARMSLNEPPSLSRSSSINVYVQQSCGMLSQSWILSADWDSAEVRSFYRVRARNPKQYILSGSDGNIALSSGSGTNFKIESV